ncbi:transcriptional regulator [Desulfolithobacter dissulfuricans]|uniref:Transcriptional regulator n=1 Tax=Desulfolithobacter dissulfuricans TaxID=2795293 RepID=A0A915UAA2_9BACT|nr:MucR family transcriptional regulator [Desulfolithobacter dissulfuricans]BCO09320.1 transcriptional regulator [Desulfolithobacter dissulfuricans]
MEKTLVEIAAGIVKSQAMVNPMSTEEVVDSLGKVFNTLKSLRDAEVSVDEPKEDKPVMDPKKSIKRNVIVCLECGQEFKMISPKHLESHGLTAKEYRKKYGFSARQPLCAKSLSERRSKSGKERGLPENLRKAIEARKQKGAKGSGTASGKG